MIRFVKSLINQLSRLLLAVSITALVCSCKISEPDPGYGPNGEARILGMSIQTIPDQNIQITQTIIPQITITLPTNFSANSVMAKLNLTPDSRVTSTSSDSVELYLFQNPQFAKISVARSITSPVNASPATTYQVVFRQTGDLAFQPITAPLSITVNATPTWVILPVYNFIDGEPTATLTLTHQQTGNKLTFPQYPSFDSPWSQAPPRSDGGVVTSATFTNQQFYESGDYRVELTKPNGRRAMLPQPLRIVRGPLVASFDNTYALTLGKPASILVANLRSSDQPSLVFRSRNQAPVTIQPSGFGANQPGIELGPITGLQPGYYYVELLANGKSTGNFNRVLVQQGNELLIQSMWRVGATASEVPFLDPTASFDTPIPMIRGQQYVPTTNADLFFLNGTYANLPRFGVFTSVGNSAQQYAVPLISDRFTLPQTIPAGRYQFTFRLIRPDSSSMEAIPLERDVLVQ